MRILYIDKANSLDEIRIAERTIWVDEFPGFGHEVFYLLKKIKNNSTSNSKKVTRNTFFVSISKLGLFSLIKFTSILFNILMTKKINLVVVRNLVDLGIITFVFAKVFRIKIMYIKAFPLIETKIRDLKDRRLNKLKVFFLNQVLKIEIFLMKKSTYLISRTEKFSQFLTENYGIKREIVSIPMGCDISSLNKISEERFNFLHGKYKLVDCLTLIYFGSLNKLRNIDFIITVVEQVALKNKSIKCFIIGGPMSEQLRLEKIIDEKGLRQYFFLLGEMDRSILFEYIQICDISISPIPPIEEYILSSPTKVIESLALGCPVIVNEEIIDQKEIVQSSNSGFSVPYNVDKFTKVLLNLITNKEQLVQMALYGLQYVSKKRSYNKLAKKIVTYIE